MNIEREKLKEKVFSLTVQRVYAYRQGGNQGSNFGKDTNFFRDCGEHSI